MSSQMTKAQMHLYGVNVEVAMDAPYDLSWPISFQEETASAFSLPTAKTQPVRLGGFVGDTKLGGSVNCHTIEVTAHGNGTHTEGIGHILDTHDSVLPQLNGTFILATVLTVPAGHFSDSEDSYAGQSHKTDRLVEASALQRAYDSLPHTLPRPSKDSSEIGTMDALVVRALQDDIETRGPRFSGQNPPYFSREAMETVVHWGVQHLLTNLPSVDREDCGGHTPNHRSYWGVSDDGGLEGQSLRRQATITEMINPLFSTLEDGEYLLQIHAPPICSDAVLSRPFLFPFSPHSS
jgi:arylformamidase